MPKIAKTLTDREIRSIKKEGFHAVGGVKGLMLRINPSGKYWVLRYSLNGKRRDLQFASYPNQSLKEARQAAQKYRNLLDDGIDPIEWRHNKVQEVLLEEKHSKIATKTFSVMSEEYIQYLIGIGKYEEHPNELKQIQSRLRKHINPVIGNKVFHSIVDKDVAQLLLPYRKTKHYALENKLRQLIGQIYMWARAMQLTDAEVPTNAKELSYLLPKRESKPQNNHPMFPVSEIPEFMKDLHFRPSISAKCLEFAILTASRSKNAREATWDQFDFSKNKWTIPANQMKKGDLNGDHIVPLSKQLKEFLAKLKEYDLTNSKYLFPSPVGGGILSDGSLKAVIQRMHNDRIMNVGKGYTDPKQRHPKTNLPRVATPHGTARASFRTWAQDDELGNDKRFSERVAELCLHHKLKDGYNGAYERNQAMKSRAEMMQAWADYCYSKCEEEPNDKR